MTFLIIKLAEVIFTKFFYVRKIIWPIFLITIIFNTGLSAQSENLIKLSGEYYYGEGIRDSLSLAKKDAVDDLIYKISVTLKSSTEFYQRETDNELVSDFSKTTKAYSTFRLKGLNFFTKHLNNGKYQVTSYVSRDDYKISLNEIFDEVQELIKLGENIESEKGLNEAVHYYYEAYLKTFLSPDPISYITSEGGREYKNIKTFLEAKVKIFLAKLNIVLLNIIDDPSVPDLFTLDISADYNGKPIDNIEMNIDTPGNPKRLVKKGKASLFLYSQPSRPLIDYDLNLNMYYKSNSELNDFHQEFPIAEKRRISVDFSKIIKIDFKIITNPNELIFRPIAKNISVSKVFWDFGDGTNSNDVEPNHTYPREGIYEVKLQINGLEEFEVTKHIDSSGVLLDTKHAQKKEPVVSKKTVLDPAEQTKNLIIGDLIRCEVIDDLKEKLDGYKKNGKLFFGRKSDFIDEKNCYIIVFNPKNKKIAGFLTPQKEYRINLIDSKRIDDLTEHFKNMAALWLEIY